ncbi:alpha/beta hydrolase [Acetobacter fallax]|uniref:Alpha/beta hydrolase fold domain-containing protein n=1 Tax=Acetobacter fallax TaxID=1737473 RepID=A0ABX0KEC9_9PROT|nr:alpha/beta hydrolase [Acetobacter fallax]NHO33461.1 alpha/beta hydrolase fold domain-containing protein [Acetobacter fallax]NHO37060.1 alpha/beta hydrolase fold domain-containing protein [Acetobacter fallax]
MPKNVVNPEFLPVLAKMPSFDGLSERSLPEVREIFLTAVRLIEGRPSPDVESTENYIPGLNNAPDVRVLSWSPRKTTPDAPAMVYIHGGGLVSGHPEVDDPKCQILASRLGMHIFSVDYRLAPEVKYPGAIEDCYAVLKWVHDNAARLGINRDKVVVAGESAGGGLSAALSLMARDKGEYKLAYQVLIYPMLDDRTATKQNPPPAFGEYVWTRSANKFAWQAYLGDAAGGDKTPAYASAARATDLTGLPPTFIGVGSMDLFLCEDLDYATRLMAASVPTEVSVVPGAYHVFDMFVPGAELSERFMDSYCAALKRTLNL